VLPGLADPGRHNVRVSRTHHRAPTARPTAPRLVALAVVAGLALAGCSSDGDEPAATASGSASGSASTSASATESPTADVSVPEGVAVTAQGTDLEFGDPAVVAFEPDQKRSTLLQMTVTKARQASIDDFKGFILDDDYKRQANYYYVDVSVENVGEGDVGGAPVPLWGVNGENTLLPPVNFTTEFKKCASTPLPKKFKPGASLDTCLVYLSPDKGSLEALSFRPDQAFDPIEWTGTVKPAEVEKKKSEKKKPKKKG
jgi:hypothetical protein